MKLNTLQLNSNAPISVIIGENGCGKSQILSSLANVGGDDRESVIAIATSVYDKFPRRNIRKNYHYIGARLGRNIPREAIKTTIALLNETRYSDFSHLFRVLDYVKFDQRMGFQVKGIKEASIREFHYSDLEDITVEKKQEIEKVLSYLNGSLYSQKDSIIWFGRDEFFHQKYDEFLLVLLKNEKLLKRLKLISAIELYLSKDGITFPFRDASSGELSLISTLIFIAGAISYNPLILIDEPENSLHPTWQREYVGKILDLFSYYSPTIVIATHSPIIISGLQSEQGVEVHKYTPDGFIKQPMDSKNAEDLFDDLFDLITPSNRSLSNKCANILNKVNDGSLPHDIAITQLYEYKNKSYDANQGEFLDGVVKLVEQIRKELD